MRAALSAPYRVLDTSGQVVAEGVVNVEPVTLPAGVYTVEILTDPTMTIEHVIVVGDQEQVFQQP